LPNHIFIPHSTSNYFPPFPPFKIFSHITSYSIGNAWSYFLFIISTGSKVKGTELHVVFDRANIM